jgi:hypothetical protein
MRATGGIWSSIAMGLVVASLFLVACESADKAPAATAISAAQSAFDSIRSEAAKYVPSQVSAAESAIANAKAAFDKNDYKAALASAQDAATKVKDMAAAAAARKTELAQTWQDMSGGLPKMAEAIKSRVDILSQSKKLPAGLDKDTLEGAKAGLASLNQTWTEASDAAKAGNMSDAIAKGQAAKTKAVEVMTALNMTVPEAAR